jgi:predicted transcriptional regulator of viral defense system
MKTMTDTQLLASLDAAQNGVYAKSDLQTAFGEAHPVAFNRRLRSLIEHGVLRRFCRGWYISNEFDLATLSQRIAPTSYVSFGTVLARELFIGTNPVRQITAVKRGRPRRYASDGYVIDHVSTTDELMFGSTSENGVRYADVEKAVLDTLYYHLRGRRYPFDIYSDLSFAKLDHARLREYLSRYHNPKFIAFVEGMMKSQ